MDHTPSWIDSLNEARALLDSFLAQPENIRKCVHFSALLVQCFRRRGTVFACGNGGSHCDAMHFAEELTGRYRKNRRPLGALALGDPSHMSCVSNDYGYEVVFSRQLEALGKSNDLLITLSTSGNSKNLITAVEKAKELQIPTIGLLGKGGGQLLNLVDLPIVVPGTTADRVQELHIKLLHISIEAMERELFPENYM